MTNSPEVSIAVPMHNESDGIDQFFSSVEEVLIDMGVTYEIVCVNDGSTDETLKLLLAHRDRNPAIKVIDFSRNFGKEIALSAAIDFTKGKTVVPIDADLQDPPSLIPELYEKWQEGHEVVHATRLTRQGESWFKRLTSNWFYRAYNLFAEVEIPRNTGDFRLMDRAVIEALKLLPERNRFMKGLFSWVGFRQISVTFERAPRAEGVSKWSYWRLWNLALDGIFGFSTFPLRLWMYAGVFVSLGAITYAIWVICKAIFFGIDAPGYASLMTTVLFLGGIQLFSIGLLGEYIGRIFMETKNRPLYIIRKNFGIEVENAEYKKDQDATTEPS
jgi:polyisoprenyl-phosphate glycosyltransferase